MIEYFRMNIDDFVKRQKFDFCSLLLIEITSPEISFLCFLRLFAAISIFNIQFRFIRVSLSNVRLDYCMLCMQKKKGEKNEK
jgi:hypothetical protein